jgi:outer membrane autotransporter protein
MSWFTNAVLRGERLDVETNWNSIGLEDQGDGSTVGLEIEGGLRFELSRIWIEPNLRLSWIDVSLPDQSGLGGDVRWEDSALTTGEVGLRIGMTEGWGGVRPHASMSFAREFGGSDETVYEVGYDEVHVADEGGRTIGRFAGGVDWAIGRVDLYGEIEARVGDMEGLGARVGARVRF